MNSYGILFGLFIIVVGLITTVSALDKEPYEMIPWRSGVLIDAKTTKEFGIGVMLFGGFVMILSSLL